MEAVTVTCIAQRAGMSLEPASVESVVDSV